ncbi:hypothetical protein FRX31_024372 [Thalictrum thalictroides]|uniref:Uncharacterized protein n=1 Tax=Thalictrum thalictroides TaxID=46969 RepID=A0A7J6VMQ0_THATH|nr:hypothetical protein FRX31_024372 [Thalictrum thalictroides]
MLKPKIEYRVGLARPLCNWGKQFTREIGIVARANASLACHRWKEIKKIHGDLFYDNLKKKFDVNFDDPYTREVVDKQLGEVLRRHRMLGVRFARGLKLKNLRN